MLVTKNNFILQIVIYLIFTASSIVTFADSPQANSNCTYIAPPEENLAYTFFQDLITRSHDLSETFVNILRIFEKNKFLMHRFEFKYPLINKEHAQLFAKAMQIKAQEAHRFVPVITSSEFISSAHLGFIRRIKIMENGPVIQEHAILDLPSNSIIFIEEWNATKNGKEMGCFAALNKLVEEDGDWYFAGTYLYGTIPSQKEIQNRIEMFDKTYENMMNFIEASDVEEVFQSLHKF